MQRYNGEGDASRRGARSAGAPGGTDARGPGGRHEVPRIVVDPPEPNFPQQVSAQPFNPQFFQEYQYYGHQQYPHAQPHLGYGFFPQPHSPPQQVAQQHPPYPAQECNILQSRNLPPQYPQQTHFPIHGDPQFPSHHNQQVQAPQQAPPQQLSPNQVYTTNVHDGGTGNSFYFGQAASSNPPSPTGSISQSPTLQRHAEHPAADAVLEEAASTLSKKLDAAREPQGEGGGEGRAAPLQNFEGRLRSKFIIQVILSKGVSEQYVNCFMDDIISRTIVEELNSTQLISVHCAPASHPTESVIIFLRFHTLETANIIKDYINRKLFMGSTNAASLMDEAALVPDTALRYFPHY